MHLLKLGIIQVLFPINLLYSSLGLEFQIFRRSYETSIHLNDPYRKEWNSSLLSCSRECYDDPTCVAFSYEDRTDRCEMNRAPSYAGSEIETGWDVYYKTGELIDKQKTLRRDCI